MKTTIYLIRHGQSEGNLKNLFLGHTDMDLTPLGHLQAENAARFFEDVHLDAIYSSDLKRAYSTALHTANAKGLPIVRETALREIYAGKWEGYLFSALKTDFASDYALWLEDIGKARCTDGESVAEMSVRVCSAVERIARENEGKTIALFTHATPIRVIKNAWDGHPIAMLAKTPWATNASVTHAEYENGTFRVITYGADDFQGEIRTKLPKNV